jgi:hypothetical protein
MFSGDKSEVVVRNFSLRLVAMARRSCISKNFYRELFVSLVFQEM